MTQRPFEPNLPDPDSLADARPELRDWHNPMSRILRAGYVAHSTAQALLSAQDAVTGVQDNEIHRIVVQSVVSRTTDETVVYLRELASVMPSGAPWKHLRNSTVMRHPGWESSLTTSGERLAHSVLASPWVSPEKPTADAMKAAARRLGPWSRADIEDYCGWHNELVRVSGDWSRALLRHLIGTAEEPDPRPASELMRRAVRLDLVTGERSNDASHVGRRMAALKNTTTTEPHHIALGVTAGDSVIIMDDDSPTGGLVRSVARLISVLDATPDEATHDELLRLAKSTIDMTTLSGPGTIDAPGLKDAYHDLEARLGNRGDLRDFWMAQAAGPYDTALSSLLYG